MTRVTNHSVINGGSSSQITNGFLKDGFTRLSTRRLRRIF
ncbi:hypothetical protein BVRB_9g210160 [Beta vulgaris subsp. vulgaris]|nr:hypothetical protein BVRB_9g210160 [Beta vulgaris subsp. vulgaris]